MRTEVWLLVAVVMLAGCTSLAKTLANQHVPAFGVSEELAEAMGCDLEDIKTRGEQYKKQSLDSGGPGYVVPRVGDTGCDVLAKLGRPGDFENVATQADESMPSGTGRARPRPTILRLTW